MGNDSNWKSSFFVRGCDARVWVAVLVTVIRTSGITAPSWVVDRSENSSGCILSRRQGWRHQSNRQIYES